MSPDERLAFYCVMIGMIAGALLTWAILAGGAP